MDRPQLSEQIRKMPKAELHLHFEGAFRWPTVCELNPAARALGERPPWMDACFGSFEDFRAVFRNYLLPATGTEERIERHMYEVLEDLARQNVCYAEPILYPPMHTMQGLSIEQVLAAVRRGIARAQSTYAIACGLIVGVNRGAASDAEAAQAREILGLAGPGGWNIVAGLDVMGDDRMGIDAAFVDLYREAGRLGLRLKVHAGELGGAEIVRDALARLGATDLSHGVGAAQDPALLRELSARGVWFHTCPTSNVRLGAATSFADHPIRRLVEAGCNVTINSDDPILFGVNITDELHCAAGELGFTAGQIKQFGLNAFRASLLPETERSRHSAEIERQFAESQPA